LLGGLLAGAAGARAGGRSVIAPPARLLTPPAAARLQGRAQAAKGGLCTGTLRATPAVVHVHGLLTLRGAGFTCKTPSGHLFPSAALILYRPSLGFAIYTVHVAAGGTYLLRVRVPAKLIAAASLNGGQERTLPTRPGTYYLTLRLFDVALPPPAEALAHVAIRS
jgi:hypothetical protein